MHDLILGTAGHIDHGKTSLVRALTGVDTDRLPEEKRRGITIELGFAELVLGDYRLGIVDVPGHEAFVRNMLAGATGMDLALLVVAADDSIKPQTREHLEILRLLDLPAGVIALTKVDLVEPEWLELVEEEIRSLVQGTFLAEAPIVRTNAPSGEGLAELRAALASAAEQSFQTRNRESLHAPFRLAIDRAFSVDGHGTVVTGSVAGGSVAVGDVLNIEPGHIEARVRGLHNHDRPVESVRRGQRAAINLAGISLADVGRGRELASPGHLAESKLLTVQVSLLKSSPRPLKTRDRVRLHVGTAEIVASVVLLEGPSLAPGAHGLAQLFLSDPVVTTWNQPFVLRSESPVRTIGGGRVLDPTAEKLGKPDEQTRAKLVELSSDDPVKRASAALFFAGLRDWKSADLSRSAGTDDSAKAAAELLACGDLCEVRASPTRTFRVHRLVLDRLGERIAAALLKLHQRAPLAFEFPRIRLAAAFDYLEPAVFDAALKVLTENRRIRLTEKAVALVGQGPQLSANERRLLAQLVAQFRQAGVEPPFVKECQQAAAHHRDSVPQLMALAASQGELVAVTDEYYLHADTVKHIRDTLTDHMANGAGVTLSQIREWLGTSRKYAVPLCEYLDRIGFTRRAGDVRTLAAGKQA